MTCCRMVSFTSYLALPTAFGRLHHGRDRLRGILCTLTALSCARKGTAAPSLPLQLAVQAS